MARAEDTELRITNRCTYLLEGGVALVDADYLSGCLNKVESLVMINELLLHAGVVLDVWWLVHSPWNILGIGQVAGLSVGETVDVL